MVKLFLLILLFAASRSFADGNACVESLTPKPPFYVTGVADKTEERFVMGDGIPVAVSGVGRKGGDKSEEISAGAFYKDKETPYGIVSRGSIVQAASSAIDEAVKLNGLVPVEVLDLNKTYEKFYPSEVRMAHKGEKGFIAARALQKSNDQQVFLVKRDMPLAYFGSPTDIPMGSYILPTMQGDQYKSIRCGNQVSYLFTLFDQNEKKFSRTVSIPDRALSCMDLSVESLANFQSIFQLEKNIDRMYGVSPKLSSMPINDWGLTRMPMKDLTDDPVFSRMAYDGSFAHYQGGDPIGTDDWIDPQSACSFLRIMSDWKKLCGSEKKCLVQMGDSSFMTPALAKQNDHDPLGHLTHYNGHCVDIRIFRKDAQYLGLNIVNTPQDYDQELTKKFIRFLIKEGATPIYFNDKVIDNDPELGEPDQECDLSDPLADKGKKVKHCEGHDNHIHFCLYSDRTKACD